MTFTGTDLPDWFTGQQWINAAPLVSFFATSQTPPVKLYGPFWVPAWDHLEVFAQSDGNITFDAIYFADAALTQLVGSQHAEASGNGNIAVNLPILGPYVQFQVKWTDGVGNATASFIVYPRVGGGGWCRYVQDGVLARANSIAIGSGASNATFTTRTVGGACHVSLDSDADLWHAIVYAVDRAHTIIGAVANLWKAANTRCADVDFYAPPYPLLLFVINDSAAVHNFFFTIAMRLDD